MSTHTGPCRWEKVGLEYRCIDCGLIYDPDDVWAPRAPSQGDPNSDGARDKIQPIAKRSREIVYRLLDEEGPKAAFQIEKRLEWPGDTVRPRLWELVKQGRITKGPEKVKTPSGNPAWLYRVVKVELRA